MKKFETPVLEVEVFEVMDVIATSMSEPELPVLPVIGNDMGDWG